MIVKELHTEKIEQVLDNYCNLIWSKLPKLIGQNTKIMHIANSDKDIEIFGLSLAPFHIWV